MSEPPIAAKLIKCYRHYRIPSVRYRTERAGRGIDHFIELSFFVLRMPPEVQGPLKAIAIFCRFCSFGLLPVTRLHEYDLEAFMDLSQPSTSSDIHLSYVMSAKSDDVPGRQLHAAGPASVAYLEQDGAGSVYLCFRGLRFGVEDYGPESLVGGRLQSQRVTAWEFVSRQMLRDHGYHEDQWPELARQFLIAHSTCPHDESRHKRAGA